MLPRLESGGFRTKYMMKYLLDTNTCIRVINGRSLQVRQKFQRTPTLDMVVCSVVKAELFLGTAKSQTPIQSSDKLLFFLSQFQSLPFDDEAAAIYGKIRATMERAGTPIGSLDMLIAAIALSNDLILVTHNTREFSRVGGLKLEDWEL